MPADGKGEALVASARAHDRSGLALNCRWAVKGIQTVGAAIAVATGKSTVGFYYRFYIDRIPGIEIMTGKTVGIQGLFFIIITTVKYKSTDQ